MRGLIFILVAFFTFQSNAQLEFPEDKVSWKFSVEQDGDVAYIVGTITMVEHWHIYAANLPDGAFALPTELKLTPSTKYKNVGKVIEPTPIHEFDELADEHLYYHSGTVKLKRKIKVTSEEDFTVKGVFFFQTCDDNHCLPPHEAEFEVKVKGVKKEVEETSNTDNQVKAENGEVLFSIEDGFAKDENDNDYVEFNGKWFIVPEGNSAAFYKKYLMLGGKHEE